MNMESATPAPALNFGQFLLALVIRPVKAFTHLAETGRPSWIWPALLTIVLAWLALLLTVPILQKEAAASFDQSIEMLGGEDMSAAMKSQMEASRTFSTNAAFLVAVPGITEMVALPILWLSGAGVLYLLSLLMGGHASFGAVFRMNAWATVAGALGRVFLLIGTLAAGASRMPGLQSLMSLTATDVVTSPVTAVLATVLSKISLFDIWYLVLVAAGMVAVSKISHLKGAAAAAIFWLVSLIPPIVMAVIGAAVAGSYMGGG